METKSEDLLPVLPATLPKWVLKKCEEELNETPAGKAKALLELRSLLQSNSITSEIDFHDDFLTQFLRRNKYRIKDAQENIVNYINVNKKEGLFNAIPDKYVDLPSSDGILVVPKRCPEGAIIIIVRLGKWNPSEVPFEHIKAIFSTVVLQLLRDPMTQINGIRFIYDFKDAAFHHLKICTPHNLHLLYHGAMHCIPGRYKSVHLVNESIFLKAFWTVVKPFISDKIRKRIFLHSSLDGLFDHLPRSVLPAEYGGTLDDSDIKNWVKIANKYQSSSTLGGQPNFY